MKKVEKWTVWTDEEMYLEHLCQTGLDLRKYEYGEGH